MRRAGLNARTLTPPIDPDELASDSPGERGRPAEGPAAGSAKTFDLTDLYSLEGWLGDAYTDLIPDRADTVIVPGRGPMRWPRRTSPRGLGWRPRASRCR